MIIEQVEALKLWLTTKLSPICDAEPSALAKYVCALVKKDKPEEDLRDICLDQLDVFLQQKTKPFVDDLFDALKAKSYITAEEQKTQPLPATTKRPLSQSKEKDEPPKKKVLEVTSSAADKENNPVKESKEKEVSGDNAHAVTKDSKEAPRDVKDIKDVREGKEPRALSRERRDKDGEKDRRDSWKDERNKDSGIRDARDIIREREGRDTREVREPRDRDVRDRDRDFRRRRSRSRSFSPRRNYNNNDDRIRRRFDDRYSRYSPDRRWGRRRSWSRSPRRNRSPLGRPRSRSPRLRSRSPPRLRSRSPRERFRSFRSRTRSRSRSPRARSWSRPESGVGGFVRSRSPQARQPDSRGSTPILDNDYSALISSSTNELPSVSSTVGGHQLGDSQRPMVPAGHGARSRCIDFEEKGFCMMGDMCPFDHGTDPVVVEDVPIPNVVPGAAPPPGAVSASGPGFLPPGHMAVRMNMQQPPPNMVEPYMPEAPGLRGPPPHFMRGMPMPHLRPPPPGMMMHRPPMERMMGPPPRQIMMQQPPPPVMDDDDLDPLIGDKEPSRIVIPAKRQYPPLEDNPGMVMQMGPPPPRMPHINQHHHMFGQNPAVRMPFPPPPVPQQPQMAGPPRKSFDFNRLGRGGHHPNTGRPPFKTGNLTLEVRKIPAELNNIAKINEHFGKFGNLTNIQVKYQGDASAALITFSNNGEATAAYKSPEPVFNNRFIKLFWHNPNKSEDVAGASGEMGAPTSIQRTGGRAGDGIDHPSLVLPVRSTFPPAHKLFLDNTKTSQPVAPTAEASPEMAKSSSIVYTSSVGHLKKTVFNAASPSGTSPKAKGQNVVTSPTATSRPADFVSRIEAIKRAEESRKIATVKQAELDAKKQELLAKQIQQQKLLIETLDKKKGTMSEVEKASLLKSLKIISDAIDKVKYASGAPKKPAFQPPTPAQMKFVSQDMPPAAPAPSYSYGRGRGWAGNQGSAWSYRGKGRGAAAAVGRTHLDNRPKTIEVKDFDIEELEEVKLHFQKFGEYEKTDLVESIPSIFITYCARPSAEMAVAHGKKFKTKTLTVRWNQMMQKLPRTESVQSSDLDDEDLSVTLGSLEEEALRNIVADKSDVSVSPLSSQPTKDTLAPESSSAGDSRSVVELSGEATESSSLGAYKRTLSEDLLMGDEHNFKASYTDDEDDEDHITVTLATTATNPSWTYAGEHVEGQGQPEAEDPSTDLDTLANTDGDF